MTMWIGATTTASAANAYTCDFTTSAASSYEFQYMPPTTATAGTACAEWDGFQLKLTYDTGTGESQYYRFQYAYLPQQDYYAELGLTQWYAPLAEMGEIDTPAFRQWVERLMTDPVYRQQQIDAQERLFAETHEIPLHELPGMRLLHRILKANPHATVEDVRRIANDSYMLQHPTAMRYAILEPTNIQPGCGIPPPVMPEIRFYDLPTTPEEVQSLRELLNRRDEHLLQLNRDYVQLLSTHYHFTQQYFKDIPHLSPEELKAADTAALKLMQEVLSPDELKALTENGEVKIPSPKDPRCLYIVKRNPSARIIVEEDGKPKEKLCIHFQEPMHGDDYVLAKILMIRHNEDGLLKTANHFDGAGPA